MVQCRNYLNRSDCLACFSAAEAQIRNCSFANGARVIYDGCLLRYESNGFFDQTTLPGNVGVCANRTISQATTFDATVNSLLSDIVAATPRINGFFAASNREVGSGGIIVYAVAQCATTVSQTGCSDCLTVAYNNIESCPPDAEGRALDAGCFLRYSDTAFFDGNQTTDLTSFLRQGGASNKNKVIIGAVVGGVALLLFVAAFIIWYRFCRTKPKRERKGDILGATELRGPMNYSYKDLASATKNFSEENKLGQGGFGDVYKGTLKNGKIVAVKKLAIGHSTRAQEEFETEVKLISNVHHRNLIRLLGCCSKRQELLLVYEYMANSSLDKFLFGDRHGTLNWKQRFDIIVGTARGLAYLHEEFHVCIIHRDIKSSNILLDDDFQPRIADFGLARLFPEDQSHINTRFAGTLGYTAPEYAIHGQLSSKVDTYSFGVVVLEIISGRKSNDVKLEPITQYLLEWAWKLYEEEMLMDLVDESLDAEQYNIEEVKKVIEIALLCTQSSVISRPSMSEVVVLLLSKGYSQDTPTRPTFIDATKRIRGDTSTSTASSASNATVSITVASGR
ncbi:hypothetical protein AQUCO_01400559v1 [Aquilegia coerulea]|uniref:Protein kinase domain-containing protein n=1 Tax=Aquilegia coerulea TaxID=218851 RepID=A0A2G5DWY9_AQUCA|nr:hypothetical protein AQUCO_01400559v1 [Aquilegia coerulea]